MIGTTSITNVHQEFVVAENEDIPESLCTNGNEGIILLSFKYH